jgi:hypothetical protein
VCVASGHRDISHPEWELFSLTAAAAIAAPVTNAGLPAKIAGGSWLVRIGAWSYAIYLTHPVVLDALGSIIPVGRRGDYATLALDLGHRPSIVVATAHAGGKAADRAGAPFDGTQPKGRCSSAPHMHMPRQAHDQKENANGGESPADHV